MTTSRNEHTGQLLQTKDSQKYRDNYDSIFRRVPSDKTNTGDDSGICNQPPSEAV